MIDWKRKLTSRKWWISVITLVSGLVLAFSVSDNVATTITGCLMSLGSAIAYTIGEGFTDAAALNAQSNADLSTSTSAIDFHMEEAEINDSDD